MKKVDPVADFLAGREAKRLTPLEESQYYEQAKSGDKKAIEILLCSQAHWIWTLCHNHPKPPQVNTDELFNEAMCQAYLAIKNFDPAKGRLSSFFSRVIPRKCSDYVVKTSSTFGKRIPMAYSSETNSFLIDEDNVKAVLAENKESNIYEDEYHSEVDELAGVVTSILAEMEPRSRWIVAKRQEGKTAEEIAAEETLNNLRSGRMGRVVEASSVMLALHAIKREVFRELSRRDIPIDCCVSGSRIGKLFDDLNTDAQNRLFD